MDDIKKSIDVHNWKRVNSIANDFGLLVKGKVAADGEERTWGGKKYKKVGGKWVPVGSSKSRTKQPPTSGKKTKQPDENKDSKPKTDEQPEVTGEIRAKLKYIKKLTTRGRLTDAHSIAEQLDDQVKMMIPQNIWDRMISSSFEYNKKKENGKDQSKKAQNK